MKMIKRLVALLVVVVLLVGAGVVVAVVYVDRIAKAAVEKGGTYALGVPTTLRKADVGLLSGGFDMSGLDVGNPAGGYKSASFMTMGEGGVRVSLGTLREDVVELPRLSLSDIQVNLEKSEGKANYAVIMENLKKLEGDPSGKPKEEGKKFVVKEVLIENVRVHVDLLPAGGELTQVNVTLDEVRLTDVGSAGKGVPLPELASIIVKALMSAIADKGAGIIPGELLADLQGRLAELTDLSAMGVKLSSELDAASKKLIEGVTEGAGKMVEDAKKEAGKAVEDARKKAEEELKKGLKGLVPGGG